MKVRWIGRVSSLTLLSLLPVCAAQADPLRPSQVLRVTFDLQEFSSIIPLDGNDVFEFAVGIDAAEPIGSFTTRLFDRSQLFGTYTGADPGLKSVEAISRFVSASSIYTVGDPTVIDFSSFLDGTIQELIEFTIERGSVANVFRVSDDVTLGRALAPTIAFTGNIKSSFEISPVPEPSSLLLLASGVAPFGAAFLAEAEHRLRVGSGCWIGADVSVVRSWARPASIRRVPASRANQAEFQNRH